MQQNGSMNWWAGSASTATNTTARMHRATSGEPEAVNEVLRHYSKRIRIAAVENGHIDRDTEDMEDRDIRTNGSSYLFYYNYMTLCSYANFRSSYRRIMGISYLVGPGE